MRIVTMVNGEESYALDIDAACIPQRGDTISLPGLDKVFVVVHRAFQCQPEDTEGFMKTEVTHIFVNRK